MLIKLPEEVYDSYWRNVSESKQVLPFKKCLSLQIIQN